MAENYFLLSFALVLDLIIGDPQYKFHPVRIIGKLISKVESLLYHRNFSKKRMGMGGIIIIISVVTGIFILLNQVFNLVPFGKEVFSIFIFYTSIAVKDLATHGLRIKTALDNDDIQLARKRSGMILSRDTMNLTEERIILGTIESISENASDSIIAPLFWGLIFGPLGSLIYRTINTMDAMWGYKNKRFIDFGTTAAILDDIVNFIPARLTGLLICMAGLFTKSSVRNAWKIMVRDHSNTASPNAGYPEAAMAGILGIQLGGNATYFGEIVIKQTLGDKQREPEIGDISYSIIIIGISVILSFLFYAFLITILRNW
ncbi:MAG: adenosylcobinamide-phosphate synthase CbiB [Spirochaetales bacterium]|nr:adenosylcobinamide-phosphate synthase CbiB [Spirochaetales bacterium]